MQRSGNCSASSDSLQQTLSTMALALSCVADAIVWTDGDGLIQWCNAAFERLVEQTTADLVSQRLTQVLPLTLEGEPLPLSLHPAAQGLQPARMATRHCCEALYGFWRHDRRVTLAITVAPLPTAEPVETVPTTNGVMLIMQAVTAREHTRSPQALDPLQAAVRPGTVDNPKSNDWVANSLESMTDAFFTLDENWCFTYLNHRVEQLLQRSRADLLGKNVWSCFPEAVNSRSHREYQRAVDEQCSVAFETFYPPLDTWFAVRAYPIANGLAVYFQDISERKRSEADRQQTEAILRASEARFRTMFDTTAVGMTVTSSDGMLLQVNTAYCQMVGYTATELLAKTCQQLIHPDDFEHGQTQLQQLLAGELATYHLERRYIHKQGHLVWGLLSVSAVCDQQQVRYVLYQIQDITDRKQAEAALRESETRLRLALEAAQMSTWDWDIPNDTVVYAGSLSVNTNVPSGTHPHAYASFLHDVHADDVVFVAQSLASALQGVAFNIEFRVNWAGETQHWVSSRGQVYFNPQGQPVRMLGVAKDITPRKQAELALHQLNQELEQRVQNRTAQLQHSNQQLQAAIAEHEQTEAALRKSEERLRTIFDNAPIAISLADAYTDRLVEVNQAHYALLGYSREDLATMTYIDFSHPDEIAQNMTLIQQLLDGSISRFQMEKRFVKKNGVWLWGNLTVTLICDLDGRVYSLGMIEDITARKHAETALLESQQFLRLVLDSMPNKIAWKDKNLRYLGCNRQVALDAGIATPEDIIGKVDAELPWAGLATHYTADDQAVITSQQARLNIEEPFLNVKGEQSWLQTSKVPLYDLHGAVIGLLVMCVDITDRRRAEESLKLTQFSVDRASDPIWWVEPEGSIYYVNDAACRDLGYSREEIIGKRVSDFSANLQIKNWADHWAMIKEKGAFKFESTLRAKDGTLFPIEVAANYMELNHKEYYCNFVRNITDRKQAENQLKNSLKEKEILLKEIHHRVKNSLQTVYSLLNLQANAIQDPQVLAPLKDSQQRVKAMALIHEKLYQSESLARINLTDYVHHLVADLIRSYSINPAQVHVQIKTAKLELAVDTVLPCGLIMNELVSNALKYAFPGDRPGSIQISFAVAPNHQYQLVIADNGVGIAESVALSQEAAHANTLGLQLVQAFVQQLQGVLTLDRSDGTRFEILFPHPA